MAYRTLISFFPTANELLTADMPRLGEALLVHLKGYEGMGGNVIFSNGSINQHNFLSSQTPGYGQRPEYGDSQSEVNQALMEAWNWLEHKGMLVRDPTQNSLFRISREGNDLVRRFELQQRWETFGVERVKDDLIKGGLHLLDVGRPPKQRGWLEEWIRMKESPSQPTAAPTVAASDEQRLSRKVFVVHGHDEAAREKVARFLERLDFKPIILHEQASRGRTVIEKVEAHSDVGFAVVLLTPDDVGCERGGDLRPRARQNVVLELGYFLGRLGRMRVCALKQGDVEIPSDFRGVVYVDLDNSEGWKQRLGRELEGAGFAVDWNKAMGTPA